MRLQWFHENIEKIKQALPSLAFGAVVFPDFFASLLATMAVRLRLLESSEQFIPIRPCREPIYFCFIFTFIFPFLAGPPPLPVRLCKFCCFFDFTFSCKDFLWSKHCRIGDSNRSNLATEHN